jgi:copper chaperone CopZ
VSVALRKIEGVDSVTVSLNEGVANIELKTGNIVDPERIRQVVRDNGFTPKDAAVSVTGRVTERDGQLLLTVTGPEVVYVLVEHPDAEGGLEELKRTAAGADVSVTGSLPETPAKRAQEAPPTLRVEGWTPLPR